MPKITIDGREFEFEQGQTVLQIARDNGIDIPFFCWHPELSIAGNCRICLVEIEKMPKLAIACSTTAAEGMVVHTKSDKALQARNAVMEFLLINHPLDCPICDEAGECKLQDYAYNHSVGYSRFREEKNRKGKRIELGPRVMFDGERCISCSRCIRFCKEVAGVNQLTFVKRGDRVTIRSFEGKSMDNPYSMNTIDICPVGALTSIDFRFKSRVWDMSATKTICTGCARGCNIDMWVRQNEIHRLTPRLNEKVNSHWMCDHGRLDTFKFVNADDRIKGPYLRRENSPTQVGWAEAYSAATSELKSYTPEETAFIASGFATCEDNYLFAKFARDIVNTNNIAVPEHVEPGTGDDILYRDDKAPNNLGAELTGAKSSDGKSFDDIIEAIEQGKIKALYVIEEDLIGLKPELEETLKKLDLLIVHSTNFNKTTELAHIIFPAAAYAEKHGTWVNFQGIVQRIRPAVATAEMDRAVDGLSMSRLDAFGNEFDRWGRHKKVDARPTWKIIVGLSNSFGNKYKYTMAEEIFEDIAAEIEDFKGLDYDVIGDQGVQLKSIMEKA